MTELTQSKPKCEICMQLLKMLACYTTIPTIKSTWSTRITRSTANQSPTDSIPCIRSTAKSTTINDTICISIPTKTTITVFPSAPLYTIRLPVGVPRNQYPLGQPANRPQAIKWQPAQPSPTVPVATFQSQYRAFEPLYLEPSMSPLPCPIEMKRMKKNQLATFVVILPHMLAMSNATFYDYTLSRKNCVPVAANHSVRMKI